MKTTLSAKLFRGVRFLFRTHVAEGFSGQCCFFCCLMSGRECCGSLLCLEGFLRFYLVEY